MRPGFFFRSMCNFVLLTLTAVTILGEHFHRLRPGQLWIDGLLVGWAALGMLFVIREM